MIDLQNVTRAELFNLPKSERKQIVIERLDWLRIQRKKDKRISNRLHQKEIRDKGNRYRRYLNSVHITIMENHYVQYFLTELNNGTTEERYHLKWNYVRPKKCQ